MYVNLHNLYVLKMNSYYSARQAKSIGKSFTTLFQNLSADGSVKALKFSFVVTPLDGKAAYPNDRGAEHAKKVHLALKLFLNHMRVLKYGKCVAGYSWLMCNEKRANRPYIYMLFYITGSTSADKVAECLRDLWIRSVEKASLKEGWYGYPVVFNYNLELGNKVFCKGNHALLDGHVECQSGAYIFDDLCGGTANFKISSDNPKLFLSYLGSLRLSMRSISGVRAWGCSQLKDKN